MPKIIRYDGNYPPFAGEAEPGERTVFGEPTTSDELTTNINAKYERGWGAGVDANGFPTEQFFNAAFFALGQSISYLMQRGVSEWDDEQEYFHPAAVLGSNGSLYTSVRDSTGADPVNDTGDDWVQVGAPAESSEPTVRVFTVSDDYTPTEGTSWIRVYVVGGGGGGGGSDTGQFPGTGGGAGATAIKVLLASDLTAPVAVTVGAGGAGGAIGGNQGGAGSTSSFGALVSCTGGTGGLSYAQGRVGGSGGVATGGDFSSNGGGGFNGLAQASNTYSGSGGVSYFGSGGSGAQSVGSNGAVGQPGIAYGSGGGGASQSFAGGDGADGIVLIEEYK